MGDGQGGGGIKLHKLSEKNDSSLEFCQPFVAMFLHSTLLHGGLNVWGLVGVLIFYSIALLVGIISSWRKKSWKMESTESAFVADRNIGLFVGICTMTCELSHTDRVSTWGTHTGLFNGVSNMILVLMG